MQSRHRSQPDSGACTAASLPDPAHAAHGDAVPCAAPRRTCAPNFALLEWDSLRYVDGMRGVCAAVVILLFATSALAQPTNAGHGFAAAGVLTASDDSADRTSLAAAPLAGTPWFVEATVFVGHQIGIGIEALSLRSVSGSSEALCCILSDD